MPRNGAGTYTLPAGNPVVDGTTIQTTWANPTMEDIAFQLNGVVTRDGLLGPTSAFKVIDGTVAAPGLSFANATNTGFWRTTTASGFSYGGVNYWSAGSTGLNLLGLELKSGVAGGSGVIGSMLVGGTTIAPTAALDVQSTTKGFKLPVMTTAQKTNITNTAGLVVFDSTLGLISYNNGSVWAESGGGGTGGTTASQITNVPFGNISATNVQGALNELDSEKMVLVAPGTSGNFLRSNGSSWVSSAFSYTFDGNVPGNLTFQSNGSTIFGNFSDTSTTTNRVFFMSSLTGNPTYVSTKPSSGGFGGGYVAHEQNGVTQSAYAFMGVTATGGSAVALASDRTGSATYLPLVLNAGGSRRLTVETGGNITMSSATAGQVKFLVENTNTAASSTSLVAFNTGGDTGYIAKVGSGEMIYENETAGTAGSHYFRTAGSVTRLIVNVNGVYSYNTLTVGDASVSVNSLLSMYSSTGNRLIQASAYNIGFALGGSTNWAAYSTAAAGNWVVTGTVSQGSDERLKTDWTDLPPDFLDNLAEVKHGTYTRIDTGVRQVGVSAQSLQPVLPEAVEEDDKGYLSVAYGSAALAACVELAKEVKLLRARVSELEGLL